jgi:hypothetical protein
MGGYGTGARVVNDTNERLLRRAYEAFNARDIDGALEQALYYRERAGEYEDWWFRRGRYDHGPETNARWFADAAAAQNALERFDPGGDVLDSRAGPACGLNGWLPTPPA